MKLLIQIFLLFFLFHVNAFPGESGELPGQEPQQVDETIELTNNTEEIEEILEENEGLDVSGVDEILEPKDTEIDLPKNRLVEIFDQYFLSELNLDKLEVVGECEKNIASGRCYIIKPSKVSSHFNNYYYYTDANNQVYSIIVFNDKKQGDLNKCKDKISLWKDYFNNFDLKEKEPTDNSLNFIMTDAPQQNSLEIFASCYTEQYRDISSSFSIRFYKNI